MNALQLKSFHLKNFKAVRDSKAVKLTPLTVFIGNNGAGKSSLIEGLEMLQNIMLSGLDAAMQQWLGFEHIWHHSVAGKKIVTVADARPAHAHPMSFSLRGQTLDPFRAMRPFTAHSEIRLGADGDQLFFGREEFIFKDLVTYRRDDYGRTQSHGLAPEVQNLINEMQQRMVGKVDNLEPYPLLTVHHSGKQVQMNIADHLPDENSLLSACLGQIAWTWQFVRLNPQDMGEPKPRQRTGGPILLATDGSNLAEYLLSIRNLDPNAFEGIISTLQAVLPYTSDLQPALSSELERKVYLQMTESNFKVPGWLFSTGTLRVLALLALLRHPQPPSLLVIEEIENGLDPRTIHLLLEEIRRVVESGATQILVTTHSPYLLDLLPLSSIVLVERINGEPTFRRPAQNKELQNWAKKFTPGKLYTMGKLSGGPRQ